VSRLEQVLVQFSFLAGVECSVAESGLILLIQELGFQLCFSRLQLQDAKFLDIDDGSKVGVFTRELLGVQHFEHLDLVFIRLFFATKDTTSLDFGSDDVEGIFISSDGQGLVVTTDAECRNQEDDDEKSKKILFQNTPHYHVLWLG